MSFLRTSRSSNAPASCAKIDIGGTRKVTITAIRTNFLVNIFSPFELRLGRGLDREVSAIRLRSPRNCGKLKSDCYGQMTAKQQLRELRRRGDLALNRKIARSAANTELLELHIQVDLKELEIFQRINPNGAVTAGAQ